MKNIMFKTMMYQYHANDWEEKKKILKNLIDEDKLEFQGDYKVFLSDRGKSNYKDQFLDLFQNELSLFKSDLNYQGHISVQDVWTAKYDKNQFHPTHNHSGRGYSGILFYEYDETEHTPPWFVDPMTDPISDKTNYSIPTVYEGSIVIVPSSVLHFTFPNTSDKPRIIIGFDLTFND